MPEINQNVDTFLDPEAMLTRLRDLESQSEVVKTTIEETRDIMEELSSNFTGESASRLQKEYADVAATFTEFRKYLQEKIDMMEQLTENIKQTDQA